MASVEQFIAKRYVRSRHRISFITIISFLSVGGITVGVAALIIVLAVFNGFSGLVHQLLQDFDPHLEIRTNGTEAFQQAQARLQTFQPLAVSEFTSGQAMLLRDGQKRGASLVGLNPATGLEVYGLKEFLRLGEAGLQPVDGLPSAVIGISLADAMQSIVGDTIALLTPSAVKNSLLNFSAPAMQLMVIRGIYKSNNNEFDAQYVFTDEPTARQMFRQDIPSGYKVRLQNINDAEEVKDEVLHAIPGTTGATWYDMHSELYSMMELERWIAYSILTLIIAVAAFNILASLSMSVIEKKRDIGVLRTMGMGGDTIRSIYFRQGVIIGLIGTLGGFALALLVFWVHSVFNIYPLNPALYKIDALPMELHVYDFIAVGCASFFLSILAAVIPAKRAAAINPIEAIRWE